VGCFRAGETYNIGGGHLHTVEDLSDVVLKVTGADPRLVQYRESEMLTTRTKRADTSKACEQLGHTNTYSLEEGMRLTAEWMRKVYALLDANLTSVRGEV
jgi:dTDP-glucose 4,6-dehydratase